ncbi:hypothetical protein C1H46_037657 [Malus baccata]|uniref:Rx N-terminal domain-containing protein n=1 Tax=Malus baccata TaxID=106549 RepID=A0A540KRG8_MALBA|nr:hypothetical protein C1H46_037657 [Malus baccata]
MVAVVVIMAAMKAALVGIRVASTSSEVALPSPWSPHDLLDEQESTYIGELLKFVQMVTDVMEAIVKRVLLAESEIDNNYELQKTNRKAASFESEIDNDYELQKTNRRAVPFGRLLTSVHVGLQMSREPILVSMGF